MCPGLSLHLRVDEINNFIRANRKHFFFHIIIYIRGKERKGRERVKEGIRKEGKRERIVKGGRGEGMDVKGKER